MVDVSDFLCGIYICIYPLFMYVKYLAYVAYMPSLVGIFVSGPHWEKFEVEVAVGCILPHSYRNVGSTYSYNMLAV